MSFAQVRLPHTHAVTFSLLVFFRSQLMIVPIDLALQQRLQAERNALRKDRPFGFFARPDKADDGSLNLMKWTCGVRAVG
jgi:hypothetical protein